MIFPISLRTDVGGAWGARGDRSIGRDAGLRYVYEGNIPGEGEDTSCPSCSATVLTRTGFRVRENRLRDGRCPDCDGAVEGIWTGDGTE